MPPTNSYVNVGKPDRSQIKRYDLIINALTVLICGHTFSFDAHIFNFIWYHKKKKYLMDIYCSDILSFDGHNNLYFLILNEFHQ